MEPKKIYLSVIVPAYNEEKRISKTLTEINSYLQKQPYESEIIVVSDGSSDRTVDVVRSFSSQIKNLEMIAMPQRQGSIQYFPGTRLRNVCACVRSSRLQS